jgi:hypothetical protein
LIEEVSAANPNTVVVLNTGGPVTMPWLSKVRGVFATWYPGQEYGHAIASLLFGDTNPSAKLPITFPTGLDQVSARDFARSPGGQYTERLAVGYRWYDQQQPAGMSANLVSCPGDAVPTAATGLRSPTGLPAGPQATLPPTNSSSGR